MTTSSTPTPVRPARDGSPPVTPHLGPPAWLGWAWPAPAIVLAALGGWLLSQRYSFWYDELYTSEVAPLALGRLLEAVASGQGTIPYLADAPPSYNPGYYLVAHAWLAVTGLAADEVGLRLLSLVAAVASLVVLYRAVTRLAGPRIALVAGLVLATNPFVVRYAVEARGYGLAMLATATVVLTYSRWLDGRPRALTTHALAVAAAGLAHWFALLVPVGLAVAGLVLRRRRALGLLTATAAGAAPALALVLLAVANGVGGSGAEWIPAVGLDAPRLLLRSWSGHNWLLAVATLSAGAIAVLDRRRPAEQRLVVSAWALVPVGLVVLGEVLRPVFVDRYLLPALLGLGVLVAMGLGAFPRPWRQLATVTFLAVSLAVTAARVQAGPLEDVRGALDHVASNQLPGEPVVAAARWDALGLDHYTRVRHPRLSSDVVLPGQGLPDHDRVWVLRRAIDGVKGDRSRLDNLDSRLDRSGLVVVEEITFPGRMADVVVQRWEPASG